MHKCVGVLAGLLVFGTVLMGETGGEKPGPRQKNRPPMKARPMARGMKRAPSVLDLKEMNLTADQRRRIEELERQMRARLEELKKWHAQQLNSILTPKQQLLLQWLRARQQTRQTEQKILGELDLARQQQAKLEAILKQRADDIAKLKDEQQELWQARADLKQMQKSNPDNRDSIRDKRNQIRTLMAPFNQVNRRYEQQILSVLTDKQRAKYQSLKKELLSKRSPIKRRPPASTKE